ELAAVAVLIVALLGRIAGSFVPPAPPVDEPEIPGFPKRGMDWHIFRASVRLVSATLHVRRLFLAILSISFFWAMGAVLAAQFPPLVKNSLGSDQTVATLFLALFSIGVAIGSVFVNWLLKGKVSARFSPVSALAMGVFVLDLFRRVRTWPENAGELYSIRAFLALPNSWMIGVDLLGVAIAGGMFVVPLYAFLTTTVPKSETARTIAANNIVNSGFMVAASAILALAIGFFEFTVADSLLIVAIASVIAAWLGWRLHLACD
ncbi:MAG TPA: MFS transporter, partial [Sphingomicrobium sp.]|nr:MFS transporter [Sphingomicrobium sp.]